MSKQNSTKGEIPLAIWLPVVGALVGTLLMAVVGPVVLENYKRTPTPPSPTPSPTPSCIKASDIIVTFRIFTDKREIDTLSSGEIALIEPGLTVYLQAKITHVFAGRTLPEFTYTWTNTGIGTDGSLLHTAGSTIDYRSGRSVITDAVSMQLSQPSCPALAPYPFFIMPKP
jgi:hypothetical protein